MHDPLPEGQSIRAWTMIDLFTRECFALDAASTFRSSDVAQRVAVCGRDRGQLPTHISVDNGTEFTSKTLDARACWNHVQLIADSSNRTYKVVIQPVGEVPTLLASGPLPASSSELRFEIKTPDAR
jgi:hypothetical protein